MYGTHRGAEPGSGVARVDVMEHRRVGCDLGFRLGVILAAAWALSWVLLPLSSGDGLAGLPAVTWAHVGLGALAVAFNVVVVFADRRR